ncbi:MAG: multiprotein bridging factor aMBF1 [archaeon]
MECELCGKGIENPRKVSLEGSILNVCDECVKYGEEVQFSRPARSESGEKGHAPHQGRKIIEPYSGTVEEDDELVEDYNKIIQRKWQESGKKMEEFAAMLNEKSSVISKLISGNMVPDDKLVKKLEHKLNIRLREPAA